MKLQAKRQAASVSRICDTADTLALPGKSSERTDSRILCAADAAARFGVSFSTLKRGWPVGKFPAPIRVSEGRIGWLESEISEWQSERIAERNARVTQAA